MPVFIFDERPSGLEIGENPPFLRKQYVANGLDSEFAVQSFASGAIASTAVVAGQVLHRGPLRTVRQGHKLYYVDAEWTQQQQQTGSWDFSFDTTGGTIHITQSKETTGKYPTSGADKNEGHDGAIGVDGDQIHGTEIVIPALRLTVSYKHPAGVVTIAHAKLLASLTGVVNSTKFLTFDAGEILFLGAQGSDGTNSEAQVQYQFAASQNATGLTIGGISGVAKKGHEYLWIQYKDDTSNGKPVKKPYWVSVERVYEQVNLAAALGFGGP